jgi:hypothetical protein
MMLSKTSRFHQPRPSGRGSALPCDVTDGLRSESGSLALGSLKQSAERIGVVCDQSHAEAQRDFPQIHDFWTDTVLRRP